MDEAALRKASAGTFGTPYGPDVQRVAPLRLLAVVRRSLEDEQHLASGELGRDLSEERLCRRAPARGCLPCCANARRKHQD